MKTYRKMLAILLALGIACAGTVTTSAAEAGENMTAEATESAAQQMEETADVKTDEETMAEDESDPDMETVETSAEEKSAAEPETAETAVEGERDAESETTETSAEEDTDTALEAAGASKSQIVVPESLKTITWPEYYIEGYSHYEEELTWDIVVKADEYRIYRKAFDETTWTLITDEPWIYEDKNVTYDIDVPLGGWYTYICCPVKKGVVGEAMDVRYNMAVIADVSTGAGSMYNCSYGVKLEWGASAGPYELEGFKLYRREVDSVTGETLTSWKGIAWIRDPNRRGWVDKTAVHGHEYEYAIRGYQTLSGQLTYTPLTCFRNSYHKRLPYSFVTTSIIYVQRQQFLSCKAIGENKVRLTWRYPAEASGVSGYQDLVPDLTYCDNADFTGTIHSVTETDMHLDRTFEDRFEVITAEIELPEEGTYYFRLRSRYRVYNKRWNGLLCFKSGRSDTVELKVTSETNQDTGESSGEE